MNSKVFNRFCKIFFLSVFALGLGLYGFFRTNVWAGFGLASSLLSIVTVFHFSNKKEKTEHVESKLTWLLLFSSFMGLGIIFLNYYQSGSSFIFGLGAGLCMIGAMAYVFELLANFLSGIK